MVISMKENRKKTDTSVVSLKYKIVAMIYLVVLFVLIVSSVKTENQTLLILSSIAISILILLNLRYIFINKKMVSTMKISNQVVTETNIHPLELYIIERVWYHKKKKFTKDPIYASLLYEIGKGNLELTEKGVKISSKISLEELSSYSLKTFEMTLLEKVDCRKSDKLKRAKLKGMQEEQFLVAIEDINLNISENSVDTDNFYKKMMEIKSKYFEDIESSKSVPLTIVSWACTLMSLLFVFTFYNRATLLNFYLPIVLVVLLVATITSKYRERVIIKKDAKEFINNALNYINYLENPERNKINEIYAYCLDKSKDNSIIRIFNK